MIAELVLIDVVDGELLFWRFCIAVGVGVVDLLRDDCPLAVCWVFGGGPRSVGDMLKLRTSRFLAARSGVFANSFGEPPPLHNELKSLCELFWLSLLYERPRLISTGCNRFAALEAVGDVGDLARRAKTLTPAPTEPLSCGCRVDADADVDVDVDVDSDVGLIPMLRLTIDGVAVGERRTEGVMRGLQLLEGLLVALPDVLLVLVAVVVVGVAGATPGPAILARVVDTLDFTSL